MEREREREREKLRIGEVVELFAMQERRIKNIED